MNSPTVSAIVPARDEEASIASAVESLAAQPEITEIIVINDQSTDGTTAELDRLSALYPQLRVLQTSALPNGWVGKNYAVSLGGAQEMHTWWERALIPFIYARLGQKFSYEAVNDPESPAAAANGQYLLIRREDYERIKGHAAVAGEVLEDVALAQLAKQAGRRLHFASGFGIIRVRMYRTFGAMWQGWTKNLFPLIGGMSGRTSRAAGGELRGVVPWIPLRLLLLTPLHLTLGVLGVVLLAGRHAAYAATLRRNRFPAALAIYYMPAVALYAAVLLTSEWRYAHGSVSWKGREYPVNRDS